MCGEKHEENGYDVHIQIASRNVTENQGFFLCFDAIFPWQRLSNMIGATVTTILV